MDALNSTMEINGRSMREGVRTLRGLAQAPPAAAPPAPPPDQAGTPINYMSFVPVGTG